MRYYPFLSISDAANFSISYCYNLRSCTRYTFSPAMSGFVRCCFLLFPPFDNFPCAIALYSFLSHSLSCVTSLLRLRGSSAVPTINFTGIGVCSLTSLLDAFYFAAHFDYGYPAVGSDTLACPSSSRSLVALVVDCHPPPLQRTRSQRAHLQVSLV